MMVKNQTDFAEFVGGQLVPPDGEFHQVKDGDDVREAIRVGTLTKQEKSSSSRSASSSSGSNDNDDNGGNS